MNRKYSLPGADRDIFDSAACSDAKGWAKIVTGKDGTQFGTWINPEQLGFVRFENGTVEEATFESEAAFAGYLMSLLQRHSVSDGDIAYIVAPWCKETREALTSLGLRGFIQEAK